LTIKSTSHTTRRYFRAYILVFRQPAAPAPILMGQDRPFAIICMPVKIFSFQRSIA
jgi:hypothetical protein